MSQKRRSFLQSIGTAALIGTTGITSATKIGKEKEYGMDLGVGRQNDREYYLEKETKSDTINLKDKDSLSQRQLENKIQELNQKYDDLDVSNIIPGHVNTATGEFQTQITTQDGPNGTENLNYLKTWQNSYDVYSFPGRLMLSTNHFVTVYQSRGSDDQGRYLYFYWMWSQTDTNDLLFQGPTNLKKMMINLDIKNEQEEVTHIAPSTTVDLNGRQKRVGARAGAGAYAGGNGGQGHVGIRGTVYVKDATMGPEVERVKMGPAGEYTLLLRAQHTEGRQALNGTVVTRQKEDRNGFADVDFNTKVCSVIFPPFGTPPIR